MRVRQAVVLCAITAAVACSAPETSSVAPAPRGAVQAANHPVDAVRRFDPANLEASLERLDEAATSDSSFVPELAGLFSEPDLNRRWAAVYVATLIADSHQANLLRPLLSDRDIALRVIAAGALAGFGVIESLPVLIEGLGSDREIPYAEPPEPISALAREALVAYTGESFATQKEWEAWWARSESAVAWNGRRYAAQ